MLIADLGNCAYGDFNKMKDMIASANRCGADLIKGQAFRWEDIRGGSMPPEFYKQCQFSVEQYIELIDYARDLGNDMFYSIFSSGMEAIAAKQRWRKVAGSQTRQGHLTMADDSCNLIVSVPLTAAIPKFKKAAVLHVSEYCTSTPHLWHIQTLTDHLGHPAGYSDHTIGVETAIRAHHDFGANVIEKHFCLEKNISFAGIVFRDSIHGATPHEFNTLAREISR